MSHTIGIAAVFIGGSNNWKCSDHAARIIKTAKVLGKWTHLGRVNTPDRWEWAEDLEVDSADGTGMSRFTHMRKAIAQRHNQPSLGLEQAA